MRRVWPLPLLILAVGCHRTDDDAKLDVASGAVPSGWVRVDLPELGMAFCLPDKLRTVPMPFHGSAEVKATTTHAYIDEGPPTVEIQVRTIDAGFKARPDRKLLDQLIKGLPAAQNVVLNGPVKEETSAIGTRFVQEAVRNGKTFTSPPVAQPDPGPATPPEPEPPTQTPIRGPRTSRLPTSLLSKTHPPRRIPLRSRPPKGKARLRVGVSYGREIGGSKAPLAHVHKASDKDRRFRASAWMLACLSLPCLIRPKS
ncbi:hypothetical protein BH11ARM2_BH11ARM2_19840 [soil metagenome]